MTKYTKRQYLADIAAFDKLAEIDSEEIASMRCPEIPK